MKKIAVFISNPIRSPIKHDQYDSFRGEGRIAINVGFGLSLLGFEVNLIFNEWRTDRNKEVWKNVYLSALPKYDCYDYAISWNLDLLKMVKYNKLIIMDWNYSQMDKVCKLISEKKINKKDVTYVLISKYLLKWEERQNKKHPLEAHFFPPLVPIPSINIGFVPYKFEPDKSKLKIYMNYRNSEQFSPKHQLIINFFRNKGYKVELNMHTKSPLISTRCPFEADNITYLYDCEVRYIDILNAIKESDLCISSWGGGIHADIISMGKPLLYIADSKIDTEKDIFFETVYEHPEYHICIYETDEESLKKLEKFIENPKESYDKYADSYKDLNFDNWKEIVKGFFNTNETEKNNVSTQEADAKIEKIKYIVIDGYRNLLSREPDFDGFEDYVKRISSGKLTIENFYKGLKMSDEHKQLMSKKDIEIIGITTCGTYPSWVDYTIASFYNLVDKVIVVNGGYDIFNPEKGAILPLKREHELIQKIDVDKKILEVVPTEKEINNIFENSCIEGKDEFGRSTNITLATQTAFLSFTTSKPHWILKLDSDQILFKITRKDLEELVSQYPTKSGFRFAQYTDYHHDFEHIGALPDEFTNDGSLFYKSMPNQSYCGQGSPGRVNVDQHPIYTIRTSHMRRITPPNVDKYEHFFKRYWFHMYGPNSIMELDYNRKTGKKFTNEQIIKEAHNQAIGSVFSKGRKISELTYDERIPYKPPLVCKIGPLEYIKQGY